MKIFTLALSFTLLLLTGCLKPALEAPPDHSYHDGRTGTAARDLLGESRFTSLIIEVQYMSGFEPDSIALVNLEDFLSTYLHKPDGINIITQEIEGVKDTLSSLEEVAAIEKANRRYFNEGSRMAVYLLYTNGVFVDPKMLGYAYRNTSAVLFGKNIWENSNRNRRPSRSDLETKVLQHELAHLMGLVNVGTTLQSDHQDGEHGNHCLNKQCLMYHLTETEESPIVMMKKPLPRLDSACLKDLRANGARAFVAGKEW